MKHCALILAATVAALPPATAGALSLEFPALSTAIGEMRSKGDSVFLPLQPFVDGPINGVTAEGAVLQQSWRVGSGTMTTQQLLAPLKAQLESDGYKVLYECESAVCGGFDFRFELETLPEPEMHVALGDYRYLAAARAAGEQQEFASLIVSRSANAGFVQLTQIGASVAPSVVSSSTKAPPTLTVDAGPVGEQLEASGHATLDDLVFKTGKVELGQENFATLQGLSDYLKARPDRQVVLVGHTDSEGSLSGNVALSKRRATAVMQRLIAQYGVNASQVSADGVGFLSPRATNLTAEGRALNRRVEVVLSSTE